MDVKFLKNASGEEYAEMGPVSTIAIVSKYAYDPDEDMTPEGRAFAVSFMNSVWGAARAVRLKRTDILETLLVRVEWTPRVKNMIEQCVQAIGNDRMRAIFAEHDLLRGA
jgi:hypothetical protein